MNARRTPRQTDHYRFSTTFSKHALIAAAGAALLISQTGCSKFFHNLKPHRLRMLNYNSSSGRDDVFFSVPDPLKPASSNTVDSTHTSPDTAGP